MPRGLRAVREDTSASIRTLRGEYTEVFQYKCYNFYSPHANGGISIKDYSLGIDWKIPTENAILSEKYTKHELLKDFDSLFSIDVDLYIFLLAQVGCDMRSIRTGRAD